MIRLPEFATVEAAVDYAAARGLVAVLEHGPTGLIRGVAVAPDVMAASLETRARRLVGAAEAVRVRARKARPNDQRV